MSYQSMVAMAASQSLITRCTAAAAAAGLRQPPLPWVQQNIWRIVATGGWDQRWDDAIATQSADVNPDTGMRSDVITDDMIRAAVAPLVDEAQAPAPESGDSGTAGQPTPSDGSSPGGPVIGGLVT